MHQRQVKVSGNIGPLHDEGVQLQPQRHWPQQICRTHGIGWAFRQCQCQPKSDTQCAGDFSERRLLGITDLYASAKQASTFGGRLGGLLTDQAQPGFERRGIAGRFGGKHGRDLPQRVDRLGLDLCRLAVG